MSCGLLRRRNRGWFTKPPAPANVRLTGPRNTTWRAAQVSRSHLMGQAGWLKLRNVRRNVARMATLAERASAYRRRMQENGWREIRIWVPDTRTAERRSSLAVQGRAISANGRDEADVLDLIGSWNAWGEPK
jgi:hypothetical protein